MDHIIAVRPAVGTTARIVQHQTLRFSRVTMSGPVLIIVRYGHKQLLTPGFECVLGPGDAVAIAQNQVFDIINTPGPEGQYRADWLAWDAALISDFASRDAHGAVIKTALNLGRLPPEFAKSVETALDAIRQPDEVPIPVAIHRLKEVLAWIQARGARFELQEPTSTSALVRRSIQASPDATWTAPAVVAKTAMSEATLRRRLAAEGTTLGELIADTRMSLAMQLLQSTHLPISRIALEVGYESASRFAIRFRRRFGFSPSAIRFRERRNA
jgi:AraC-like DNA-binding protein